MWLCAVKVRMPCKINLFKIMIRGSVTINTTEMR
jgi:hypothetical protein